MSQPVTKRKLISDHFKYRALLRGEDSLKTNQELSEYFSEYFEKAKRIATEPLNLAVLGEFSVGKSSFINHLLEVNVLPVGITPITSTVTTMKYGKNEKVEIRYCRDNGNEEIISYKSYSILADYQKASEIDNEIYRKEVESIREIIVYLDNKNLKKFNIIDTPGFNHSVAFDDITRKIFDRLDFAVWLFDAAQAGKLTESNQLNELFAKVNNVYAIINKIDIIDSMEIDQVAEELSNKIIKSYENKFINNEKILSISLKNPSGEFSKYYQNFIEDFNASVIDKDYDISCQEIESIHDEIHLQLVQIQHELAHVKDDCNELLETFIRYTNTESYKTQTNKLSQEIYEVIISLIKEVVAKIKASEIYDKLPENNPTLKFYCLYKTFEKIEQIKQVIGNSYSEYLSSYKDKFKQLADSLNESVEKITNLYPPELKKELEKTLHDSISIINGFIAKKDNLSTTGYIFGLLSNDFIYNKFIHGSSREKDDLDDVPRELNREILIQLFKFDLETKEVENKLTELKEKINFYTENIVMQLTDISRKMQVTKC